MNYRSSGRRSIGWNKGAKPLVPPGARTRQGARLIRRGNLLPRKRDSDLYPVGEPVAFSSFTGQNTDPYFTGEPAALSSSTTEESK